MGTVDKAFAVGLKHGCILADVYDLDTIRYKAKQYAELCEYTGDIDKAAKKVYYWLRETVS